MKRFNLKALLALVMALCLSVSSLSGGAARAEETPAAPIWEALEAGSESEFNLAVNAPALEEEEEAPAYSDDDVVRVFIVFEDESVIEAGYSAENIAENKAAMKYADKLEAVQDKLVAKIEKEALNGETLQKNYNFTLFTNAVSADVQYKDLKAIEAIDGVSAVHIAPVYETLSDTVDPETMTAGEMVGSYRTWESGYTGAGAKIAIIDTGIDVDHPSFSEDGYLYGLKETAEKFGKDISDYDLLDVDDIAAQLENLKAFERFEGLTADDLYVNAKIPYGFNYVDRNLDLAHYIDPTTGEHDEHGSHVAGIASANKYINYDGVYDTQTLGVVGIAPDAQLMVMRVFGVNGGASADDYMAAIEDAVLLGADSVNLSLGSANAGESKDGEAFIDEIFDRITQSSTLVVISAGNSGSWGESSTIGGNLTDDVNLDTVGSPGSYTNAFTVASATNTSYTDYASVFNGTQVVNYLEGQSANNLPLTTLDTTGNGTEYDYVLIPAYGEPEDFENVDVKDKIVLVSRGEISFYQKLDNAAAAGAAGLFVFNNTDGRISMNLSGSSATIPAVSITLAAAQEIVANSVEEANGTYTGKVVISDDLVVNFNYPDGFLMSDFSSWGVPGDLALKPEITAPGGNIYSTTDDGTYSVFSGTSMAAPSVAGLSALVLQYLKENNLTSKSSFSMRQIAQSLLMSTATPLKQRDGVLYSPRKQGAGLANAAAATSSPAYIIAGTKTGNDGKAKVELGDDPERTGKYDFYFRVYNMSDRPVYYKFDSTVLTEAVADYYFIANSSYELDPKVSYTSSRGTAVYLYDLDNNGVVNKSDVNKFLKVINQKQENGRLSAFPGAFDLNNSGTITVADAALLLQAIQNPAKAKIDLSEQIIAVAGNGYEKITVTIELSDADKEYLDTYFANGMYVDGFIQLDGKVDLSLPFLGFYGNWSDASMFDPFDSMEYFIDKSSQFSYNGTVPTNYLSYQFVNDNASYYYSPNMYEVDNEYIADRNSFSSVSGDRFAKFNFTLIRNAADLALSIKNAETGEVYVSSDYGPADSTYYHVNRGQWYSTRYSVPLNWAGTDASRKALPDGTKVNITLTAYPSYYEKNPDKPLGKGVDLTFPVTIDNTAPVAELVEMTEPEKDEEGNVTKAGTITAKFTDNRYVSAVYLVDSDKTTVLDSFAINQTEAGATTELTFNYPEKVFYVFAFDYAGNTSITRVNASSEPDATIVEDIELSSEYLTLTVGGSAKLTAKLTPENLADTSVVWVSLDEDIATIDENGVVTGVSEGIAIVGAVTNALAADGEPLAAVCYVEVINIDVDLNTTLWDEVGGVYFGKFNTTDLALTKLSEKQTARFNSAVVVDGVLYATTIDNEESDASMYKVNPDTFESELLADDLYENVDLAYGPGSGYLYAPFDGFMLVETLDGEWDGYYSVYANRDFAGDYITGITLVDSFYYEGLGEVDIFYIIDDTGVLYEFDIANERYYLTPLGETGASTNGEWEYDSLYFDDETGFIFYSCYDGSDDVSFYAIADYYNSQTGEEWVETYPLGQFATTVWPVSGLYQWDNEQRSANRARTINALENSSNDIVTEKLTSISDFESQSSKAASKIKVVEAPVEEAPIAETPVEEVAPVEETPAEEAAPVEEAPVFVRPTNGIAKDENGVLRYWVNTRKQYALYLIELDGDLYYISGSGVVATGKKYITAEASNGLVPQGTYYFDEDGKMIR